MTVLTLGLNHTTAAVDLRGKFAFAVDQLAPTLKTLHQRLTTSQHAEVALLSTYNRTELYCAAGDLAMPARKLQYAAADWLSGVGGV